MFLNKSWKNLILENQHKIDEKNIEVIKLNQKVERLEKKISDLNSKLNRFLQTLSALDSD